MTTAVFVGDSLTVGALGVTSAQTFPNIMAPLMGWTIAGLTGVAGGGTYANDVLLDAIPGVAGYGADVVCVAAGTNDQTDVGFAAMCTEFWTALRAAMPTTTFYSIGVHLLDLYTGTNVKRDAIIAASRGVGATWVDWAPWEANIDLLLDGLHPSVAGHLYLGYRLAYELGQDRFASLSSEAGLPFLVEVPA